MASGIYQIKNQTTNEIYIGSSQNIKKRWQDHLCLLKKNKHHSLHLQRSWNKHGPSIFEFSILFYCELKDLIFYEQRSINIYRPKYNISPTAGSCIGIIRSEETRKRISLNRVGKCLGVKNHFYGKTHSKETIKKISDANKNKHLGIQTEFKTGHVPIHKGKSLEKLQGSKNNLAKLTEELVKEILISTDSAKDLSIKYGVHKDTIRLIKLKKIWKHVYV